MKKFYKITGIALGICFAVGLVLAVMGAAMGAKGVIALTKEHGIQILDNMDSWSYKDMDVDAFESISIDTRTADVNIVASKDGKYGVDVNLIGNESTIKVVNENGVLSIKDTGSDLGFIISLSPWGTSYDNVITIYVPEEVVLKDIELVCNAGDIDIDGISGAEKLAVTADAGDIDVSGGKFGTISVTVSAGDVTMEDISVSQSLNADMAVGDLDVSGNIAADVYVKSNVGDIDITTKVSSSEYKYDITVNVGDIEVFGHEIEGFDGELTGNPDGKYTMHLESDMGDITVK